MTNVKATFRSLEGSSADRKTPASLLPSLAEEFGKDYCQLALRGVIESDLTPKQKLYSFFILLAYRLFFETLNKFAEEQ
jgi:hypothetical protein